MALEIQLIWCYLLEPSPMEPFADGLGAPIAGAPLVPSARASTWSCWSRLLELSARGLLLKPFADGLGAPSWEPVAGVIPLGPLR